MGLGAKRVTRAMDIWFRLDTESRRFSAILLAEAREWERFRPGAEPLIFAKVEHLRFVHFFQRTPDDNFRKHKRFQLRSFYARISGEW